MNNTEDIMFSSVEELYERIKPALMAKCQEMKRSGYAYITENDIWNYLKEKKWKTAVGLSLAEMVSDVLDSDDVYIDSYFKDKLNTKNRKLYFEE